MKIPHLKQLVKLNGFVLASGSPRRKQILEECGFKFEIMIPDVDEKSSPVCPPQQLVLLLAEKKVMAVRHDRNRAYLGCDTIVVFSGKILNKPKDDSDAAEMLMMLSGQTHSVFTGLALYDSRRDVCFSSREESRVTFKRVTATQISEYIATGESGDKAGAYGIQGMGRFLVDSVTGNIDNVIGLPVAELECLATRYREHYD